MTHEIRGGLRRQTWCPNRVPPRSTCQRKKAAAPCGPSGFKDSRYHVLLDNIITSPLYITAIRVTVVLTGRVLDGANKANMFSHLGVMVMVMMMTSSEKNEHVQSHRFTCGIWRGPAGSIMFGC